MTPTTSPGGWVRRTRRVIRVAAFASVLAGAPSVGHAVEPPSGSAILRELRDFNTMGSVLYVAAHPDDENTQVITYLARGRGYRTAYLSLTRGDGGQNLLGPQFQEQLGVARTQELLAARRLDGVVTDVGQRISSIATGPCVPSPWISSSDMSEGDENGLAHEL